MLKYCIAILVHSKSSAFCRRTIVTRLNSLHMRRMLARYLTTFSALCVQAQLSSAGIDPYVILGDPVVVGGLADNAVQTLSARVAVSGVASSYTPIVGSARFNASATAYTFSGVLQPAALQGQIRGPPIILMQPLQSSTQLGHSLSFTTVAHCGGDGEQTSASGASPEAALTYIWYIPGELPSWSSTGQGPTLQARSRHNGTASVVVSCAWGYSHLEFPVVIEPSPPVLLGSSPAAGAVWFAGPGENVRFYAGFDALDPVTVVWSVNGVIQGYGASFAVELSSTMDGQQYLVVATARNTRGTASATFTLNVQQLPVLQPVPGSLVIVAREGNRTVISVARQSSSNEAWNYVWTFANGRRAVTPAPNVTIDSVDGSFTGAVIVTANNTVGSHTITAGTLYVTGPPSFSNALPSELRAEFGIETMHLSTTTLGYGLTAQWLDDRTGRVLDTQQLDPAAGINLINLTLPAVSTYDGALIKLILTNVAGNTSSNGTRVQLQPARWTYDCEESAPIVGVDWSRAVDPVNASISAYASVLLNLQSDACSSMPSSPFGTDSACSSTAFSASATFVGDVAACGWEQLPSLHSGFSTISPSQPHFLHNTIGTFAFVASAGVATASACAAIVNVSITAPASSRYFVGAEYCVHNIVVPQRPSLMVGAGTGWQGASQMRLQRPSEPLIPDAAAMWTPPDVFTGTIYSSGKALITPAVVAGVALGCLCAVISLRSLAFSAVAVLEPSTDGSKLPAPARIASTLSSFTLGASWLHVLHWMQFLVLLDTSLARLHPALYRYAGAVAPASLLLPVDGLLLQEPAAASTFSTAYLQAFPSADAGTAGYDPWDGVGGSAGTSLVVDSRASAALVKALADSGPDAIVSASIAAQPVGMWRFASRFGLQPSQLTVYAAVSASLGFAILVAAVALWGTFAATAVMHRVIAASRQMFSGAQSRAITVKLKWARLLRIAARVAFSFLELIAPIALATGAWTLNHAASVPSVTASAAMLIVVIVLFQLVRLYRDASVSGPTAVIWVDSAIQVGMTCCIAVEIGASPDSGTQFGLIATALLLQTASSMLACACVDGRLQSSLIMRTVRLAVCAFVFIIVAGSLSGPLQSKSAAAGVAILLCTAGIVANVLVQSWKAVLFFWRQPGGISGPDTSVIGRQKEGPQVASAALVGAGSSSASAASESATDRAGANDAHVLAGIVQNLPHKAVPDAPLQASAYFPSASDASGEARVVITNPMHRVHAAAPLPGGPIERGNRKQKLRAGMQLVLSKRTTRKRADVLVRLGLASTATPESPSRPFRIDICAAAARWAIMKGLCVVSIPIDVAPLTSPLLDHGRVAVKGIRGLPPAQGPAVHAPSLLARMATAVRDTAEAMTAVLTSRRSEEDDASIDREASVMEGQQEDEEEEEKDEDEEEEGDEEDDDAEPEPEPPREPEKLTLEALRSRFGANHHYKTPWEAAAPAKQNINVMNYPSRAPVFIKKVSKNKIKANLDAQEHLVAPSDRMFAVVQAAMTAGLGGGDRRGQGAGHSGEGIGSGGGVAGHNPLAGRKKAAAQAGVAASPENNSGVSKGPGCWAAISANLPAAAASAAVVHVAAEPAGRGGSAGDGEGGADIRNYVHAGQARQFDQDDDDIGATAEELQLEAESGAEA